MTKFCLIKRKNQLKTASEDNASEHDEESSDQETTRMRGTDEWEDSDEESDSEEEEENAVHIARAKNRYGNDCFTMREDGTRLRKTSAPYHSGNWRA